ncbi:hypothetical protein DFH28DRAFT_466387 [Melampsora americana]|nr:hypothetical protein DFH28DRAFT_466387 [Melampsora americana]
MLKRSYDADRHEERKRNCASIVGEVEGGARTGKRLPSPTSLFESSIRQNLHNGTQSPSQVNRTRNYLGPTCPSYNKLDPITSNEMSSRAILSKFLSRPDDDSQSGTWSDSHRYPGESRRLGSRLSFQSSPHSQRPGSPSWGSGDIGRQRYVAQDLHEHDRRRDEAQGSSNAPESRMSRLQYSNIHPHNEANDQASSAQGTSADAADIHPIRLVNRYGEEEFRCPDCL